MKPAGTATEPGAGIDPAHGGLSGDELHLVWVAGTNCDGCTIKALGDPTAGGLEALLTGRVPGLPRIRLHHPILSVESGRGFSDRLEAAARGELGPYGLINEASVPDESRAGQGFFSALGEDAEGRRMTVPAWLERLAPRALFVLAWGDCAVWGGPHSLRPNPTGSTGTAMHLGPEYRSALGLPVVNLPGCAAPAVLISVLVSLIRWARGAGPPLELDDVDRPAAFYGESFEGALVTWSD